MKQEIEKYTKSICFKLCTAMIVVGSMIAASAALAFPLDLIRPATEQTIDIPAQPHANSQTATVTLNAYDGDMKNEGSLSVNGGVATNLFADLPENDVVDANYTFTMPAKYWRKGSNTLLFRRLDTWGYKINAVSVAFDGNNVSCILPDNSVIENCESFDGPAGEKPNILIQWTQPYDRENSDILPVEEIKISKIYFQRISDNVWTEQTTENPATNSVFVYKEPEIYGVVITTVDTGDLEAAGSDKVVADIGSEPPIDPPIDPPVDPPVEPPVEPPQPPLIVEVPAEGIVIKFIQEGTAK